MSTVKKPIFKRILLKLSGEALQADALNGIDVHKLAEMVKEISHIATLGVQVAIVIGGGNFVRGSDLAVSGIHRVTADQLGMLGTIMNGLALRDVFIRESVPVQLLSALGIASVVEPYNRFLAKEYLDKNQIVIFAGGTGNPLVSTDSAAALRAIEIDADIVLKATKVNGVYSDDPIINPKAECYTILSHDDVVKKQLKVMDLNAVLLCRDHGLPIRVFNMNRPEALLHIICGEKEGTLITSE